MKWNENKNNFSHTVIHTYIHIYILYISLSQSDFLVLASRTVYKSTILVDFCYLSLVHIINTSIQNTIINIKIDQAKGDRSKHQ